MNIGTILYSINKNRYDVVIFGEDHEIPDHSKTESACIQNLLPEFTLAEGFDDKTPQETKPLVADMQFSTIQKVMEKLSLSIKDFGSSNFKLSLLVNWQRIKNRFYDSPLYEGECPKDLNSLFRTHIYDLSISCLLSLQKTIQSSTEKSSTSLPTRLNLQKLNDSLSYYSRYYFYSSNQEQISNFDLSRKDFQSRYFMTREFRILQAVYDIQGELAGCDISSKPSRTSPDASNWARLNKFKRERRMASSIIHYIGLRKRSNPIVTIVGSDHIRRKSTLLSVLSRGEVRIKLIDLCPTTLSQPLVDLLLN